MESRKFNFLEIIKSLFTSYSIIGVLVDIFNGTIDLSDYKEIQKRRDICYNCNYLFKLTKQCKQCGCFIKAKTIFSKSKCPIGKW
jgi:hypothetical protein